MRLQVSSLGFEVGYYISFYFHFNIKEDYQHYTEYNVIPYLICIIDIHVIGYNAIAR